MLTPTRRSHAPFAHIVVLLLLLIATITQAQQLPPVTQPLTDEQVAALRQVDPVRDGTAPLATLERELHAVAHQVLHNPDVDLKYELNAILAQRLKSILARPESFDYPFDSLVTLSKLKPEDNSFRLWTWYIRDDKQQTHQYFGIIQRRIAILDAKGKPTEQTKLVLIDLTDKTDIAGLVEGMTTSQNEWVGALYYHPRNTEFGVQTYKGKYYQMDGLTGKSKKKPVTYYTLLGWNGHQQGSDFKVVEVLYFLPGQDDKAYFGAPIFYFGLSPKSRVVFKYSDNSPFSLNMALVPEKKCFVTQKHLMITFDHIGKPIKTNPVNLWDYGADGTYDALWWINRVDNQRKGFFVFIRDVPIIEPKIEGYSYDDNKMLKELQKQIEEQQKKLMDELDADIQKN